MTARALSLLGDEAALVAMALRIQGVGYGPAAIAALLAAGMLPLVAGASLAGRLADTLDSRYILVPISLAQAAVCVPLIFVHSIAPVVALVALLGAGQAVAGPTWTALLPRISGEDGIGAAMSLGQISFTMAGMAAPAIGGSLSGWLGTGAPLAVDAATYAVLGLVAALLKARRAPGSKARRQRFRGGLTLLRRDPLVAPLLTGMALFVLLGMMANVVEIFLVRRTLHASALWYGGLGAMWAAASLLGAVAASRISLNSHRVKACIWGIGAMTVAFMGFAVAPTVSLLIPVATLGGVGNGLINVCFGTVVMTRTLDRDRGRVSASLGAVMNSAAITSLLLGAVLASFVSPREVFFIAGILGSAAVVVMAPRVIRAARLASVPDAATEPGLGSV